MKYDRRIRVIFDRAVGGGRRPAPAAPARSGARGDPAPVFQPAYGGGVRALDQALHLFFGEAPSCGTGRGGGDGVSESSRGGAQGRRIDAESGALGAPVSVQGGARPRARMARRAASRHASAAPAGGADARGGGAAARRAAGGALAHRELALWGGLARDGVLAPAGEGRRPRVPADAGARRQGREGPSDHDAGEARRAARRSCRACEVVARARPRGGGWGDEPALRARSQVSARRLGVGLAVRVSRQTSLRPSGGRGGAPPPSVPLRAAARAPRGGPRPPHLPDPGPPNPAPLPSQP